MSDSSSKNLRKLLYINKHVHCKWLEQQPVNKSAQVYMLLLMIPLLSYLQQRDVKMQKVAMECLYRLVWLVF